MKNIAIFPGSFDPFTDTHEHVVRQAIQLYDKVIIRVTDTSALECHLDVEEANAMCVDSNSKFTLIK